MDDAIVVVENTARHLDSGLRPKDAAIKAMEEITGPVIATTLVLIAAIMPTQGRFESFVEGAGGSVLR